jgi:hypothetical protein
MVSVPSFLPSSGLKFCIASGLALVSAAQTLLFSFPLGPNGCGSPGATTLSTSTPMGKVLCEKTATPCLVCPCSSLNGSVIGAVGCLVSCCCALWSATVFYAVVSRRLIYLLDQDQICPAVWDLPLMAQGLGSFQPLFHVPHQVLVPTSE